MPQRPREHQLETESRLAFHTALPSAWVLRNLTDDYGIDAEVELFDAKGFATGERFLVQLKATDETDETRALKVSLPRETGRILRLSATARPHGAIRRVSQAALYTLVSCVRSGSEDQVAGIALRARRRVDTGDAIDARGVRRRISTTARAGPDRRCDFSPRFPSGHSRCPALRAHVFFAGIRRRDSTDSLSSSPRGRVTRRTAFV